MEEVFLSNNLKLIHDEVWRKLEQAVKSYRSPFHSGIIASVSNQIPQLRTVIIRRVDTSARLLFFHTDIRSEKIQQIKEHPTVSWLFYDEKLKIQLRMRATAIIHTKDDVADYGWSHSRLASKLCYTTSSPSGTKLIQPELINLNVNEADEVTLEMARRNFIVVETNVKSLDWLFLHHEGNRRAFFDYENGTESWMQV